MPEDNTSELRTDVSDIGNPGPPPSFEIAPEDQHHLDAVRASGQQLAPGPCVALASSLGSPSDRTRTRGHLPDIRRAASGCP